MAQKTVSLSTTDGYTLALGNDVTLSSSSSSSDWSGYRYGTTYSTSAGYTLSGNTISYTSGSSNFSALFTLSGVTSTSEINVNNSAKTVTLTANNLGTNDITISGNNGYKLALASGIVQSKTVDKSASLINGKYTSASYKTWYELSDTKITYHAATTAKTFTISGLSDDAALDENVIVSENKVSILSGAISSDHKTISISGGNYQLDLPEDDTLTENISYTATESNGVYTVTLSGTKAGYKLVNNSTVKLSQSADLRAV